MESIRDYTDKVVDNKKTPKRESEVCCFVRSKGIVQSDFVCRKNCGRSIDPLLDQFDFYHMSCYDESEFSYEPCIICLGHTKPFVKNCKESVDLRSCDIILYNFPT